MMWFIKSKKVVLTSFAMALITIGTIIIIDDIDKLCWFTTIIAGSIGSYNIGQGIADSCSLGHTLTQKAHTIPNRVTLTNGKSSGGLRGHE